MEFNRDYINVGTVKITPAGIYSLDTVTVVKKNLPKRYIINKGATILFWEDGSKTVVKRGNEDEYDNVKGFLWAYFQKHSGLSKTQANKYLAELMDEDDIKFMKILENGTFYSTLSNVSNAISNGFKNIAESFNKKDK